MKKRETYCDGVLTGVYHSDNNKYHNTTGPAIEEWWEDTHNKKHECYYIHGQLNRANGPAIIRWYADGQLEIERFFIDDKLHNENGPAQINYDKNGRVCNKSYYVNDLFLTEEAYYEKYPHASGNPGLNKKIKKSCVCEVCGNPDEYLSEHKVTGKMVCYLHCR